MKKILLLLIMMVFTSILIIGSSINVKVPNDSTILLKGQVLKINWSKNGAQHNFVKISLLNSNGSKKILSLTERTQNNGTFNWKFTENVPNGRYIIRIITRDNKITRNSNLFRIGKNGSLRPPPHWKKLLSVIYPNGKEKLLKNSTKKIIWNVQNMSGNLILELWKGNRKYGTIANNIPVIHKQYNWTVGKTFGNALAGKGNNYRIKILSQGIMDMSNGYFSISEVLDIPDFQNDNIPDNIATFNSNSSKPKDLP